MQALNKHHKHLLYTWHRAGGRVRHTVRSRVRLKGEGLSWGREQKHTNTDFREMQLH